MAEVLPKYTAALKKLDRLPLEFDRTFWTSGVDAMLADVRARYETYAMQAGMVGVMTQTMSSMVNVSLKISGQEALPVPEIPQVGVCILPDGTMDPALLNHPAKVPGAVLMTFTELEKLASATKSGITKGEVVATSEAELAKLVYTRAARRSGPGSISSECEIKQANADTELPTGGKQ